MLAAGAGRVEPADVARIVFVATAGTLLGFGAWQAFGHPRLFGLVVLLVGGYPILAEALKHIVARRMTMELSMTIALAAALVIGEVTTALVMTAFVLLAEMLERLTVSRGRQAVRQLLDLLPQRVSVRRDGALVDIPVQQLLVGEEVVVRPGGRIPVDGLVVGGESFVNQSAMTGESIPIKKNAGCLVFAGTINQSGALDIEAERIGRDTGFGQIIDAVERADERRAPIQRTADRLAGYLVYFSLAAATVTFLLTRDPRATIAVIIVAGACGVAAGTPLAILGAIGRAARNGTIIKGGVHLESLWGIDTVVLDKTGTITEGDVRVRRVYRASSASDRQVVETAAIAEGRSEHPIGRAIVRYAEEQRISAPEPDAFVSVAGQGVRVQYAGEEILVGTCEFVTGGRLQSLPDDFTAMTNIFVMRGGRYLGSIAVADVPRPEAQRAIADMKALGLTIHLLTGDSQHATTKIARELGIDAVDTGLLPSAKLAHVEALTKSHRVAMIGDGVNDAPALVAATVGIAMGSGTDVARESADVVLIGNDLLKFVDVLRLARRTRSIILQNFAGTLVIDGLGMALAAGGWLTPLVAALIHVASEVVFVLNSARLLPPQRSGTR